MQVCSHVWRINFLLLVCCVHRFNVFSEIQKTVFVKIRKVKEFVDNTLKALNRIINKERETKCFLILLTCHVHQFILKLEVTMSMHGCFHHLETIKIIVVIGVVDLKVVKALLVVSHVRDVFVINSHSRQVFLNVTEVENNLSNKFQRYFDFLLTRLHDLNAQQIPAFLYPS